MEAQSNPRPNREFIVAKNPREGTRLPYIISLPVSNGTPIILACGSDWPSTKDVFCLELSTWPEEAEILERVPVTSCWRAGKAVHLVLARRQRRRSMFVWTESRGRTLIFWRTQKTMRSARPGLKVPQARRLEKRLEIAVDYRERYPWRFKQQGAVCTRRELPVGDYGILVDEKLVAAVERKTVQDLLGAATDGNLSFVLAELSRLPYGCVIVEGRFSDVLKYGEYVNTGWAMNVLAALQVTYPRVTWTFAETRSLAEEFAYRWLSAAYRAAIAPDSLAAEPSGPTYAEDDGKSRDDTEVQQPLLMHDGYVHDRQGRMQVAVQLAHTGRVWTTKEYAAYFGVSYATARKDLLDLVQAGSLVEEGTGRPLRYVRAGNV